MFRAFREISHAYPKLLKCISTNGLLLAERSDELIDVGIDTLTVTVNAVRPDILTEIVPAIHYEGVRITGEDAAEILIENQLRGIAKMAGAGVTIKVNSVFVPELNGAHIPEIARAVRGAGAEIYNIIPLIPQHRMSGYKAPGCEALDAVRNEAGRYIDVFRHCQHCRADAVGIPGISELSGVLAAGGLNETDGIYMQAEDVFSHG
jgi:nitrogen fixation protein NifB